MKEIISNLPEAAKADFLEHEAPDMIENFQTSFNSLAVCFAHAVLHEPDMIASQTENVRGALIWMEEQLDQLREIHREYENQKFVQTLKK